MSEKNTVVRSMHDLGLAAWFGGSLMGAVGLNGATAEAQQPTERLRLSSLGWSRWTPVNAVAIGAHLVGSVGMLNADKDRVATQPGAGGSAVLKTVLTAAAMGLTAYSRALGKQVEKHQGEGAEGVTEPHAAATEELTKAQQRLKVAQWAIPAVTGALVVLGAQQGEQQRPQSLARAGLSRLKG